MAKNTIPTTGLWSAISSLINLNFDQIFSNHAVRIGFADYDDDATSTTPISVISGVETKLTNDAAGAQTNSDLPSGVTALWDSSNNQFDFSSLKNGDMVDIRVQMDVTTTAANQEVNIELNAAIGGFTYKIPFVFATFKTAGTYKVSRFNGIYIGDDNTRLNPSEFVITSDSNASVVVGGWYVKAITRGFE